VEDEDDDVEDEDERDEEAEEVEVGKNQNNILKDDFLIIYLQEENDEEPLNSEDDVTDEDPSVLFETDNVVVCQYDKVSSLFFHPKQSKYWNTTCFPLKQITRSRNRWKFHLKDGIMNINGRDYVFQKANGDAEW